MKIVVTGGTGFIGSALVAHLVARGHEVTVIDRNVKNVSYAVKTYRADLINGRLKPEWFEGADAIIHLAGAPLIGHPWTRTYRQEIRDSRITSAKHIIAQIAKLPVDRQPHTIISASAVGIYGDQGDEVLTENALLGRDFLAQVCRDWEAVWGQAHEFARVVNIRTGIVVAEQGGIVAMLRPMLRMNLGAVIGSGMQWMSWVSLHDLIRIYTLAVEDDSLRGPVNAVAPRPLRNKDFMRGCAEYFRSSVVLRVPAWLVRAVLGGVADLLLFSQRVKPTQLIKNGFNFEDETVKGALKR